MLDNNTELAISKAEAIELDRYRTYREKAGEVLNHDAKQLIQFLMRAEKRHLALIRRQRRFPLKKINAKTAGSMKVFKAAEMLKKEKNASIGDINILKIAEKIETEDCPFYGKLIKETDDKNVRALFMELRKQECLHLALVRKKLKEMQQLGVALSRAKNPRSFLFAKPRQ